MKIHQLRIIPGVHSIYCFWFIRSISRACTNKSSSAEMAEAINSMFLWYNRIGRFSVSAPPRDSATNMPSTSYPRAFAADPAPKSNPELVPRYFAADM